jgi:hypothetical protein
MVRISADRRAARTYHPDAVALDIGVEFTGATMFLQEGVEVGEQGHPPSLAY